jgi:hypothetical protein
MAIELKQRKVCGNCRAIETISGTGYRTCSLNYMVGQGKTYRGIIVEGIPQEPCPKPTTYNDFIEANKHYRR